MSVSRGRTSALRSEYATSQSPHIRKARMCEARIIKGRPFRSRLWLLCEAVSQA